jgi:hypothetical protein
MHEDVAEWAASLDELRPSPYFFPLCFRMKAWKTNGPMGLNVRLDHPSHWTFLAEIDWQITWQCFFENIFEIMSVHFEWIVSFQTNEGLLDVWVV